MTPAEARAWLCAHLRPVLEDELAAGAEAVGFVSGLDNALAVTAPQGPPRDYPAPVTFWDDFPKRGNPYGVGGGYTCPEHGQLLYLVGGSAIAVNDNPRTGR
ncbi:hypothetical protein GCM10009527_055060 [Actinomadura nitritigenes]|uniref:Uncharacterized protein n=1 Tax=Actinomadura nitritigenes TaxID=134602 RepID=A0ABS3R8T1_9ACTN|nr:hypothetical protein [Actinomadura nitritigenes]MBO2442638.1 hypothetical protein [Actinomadura nitritigenes]